MSGSFQHVQSLEARRLLANAISGTVFQDNNGNGVFDSGEPPMSGITVWLDSDDNGVINLGEVMTSTGALGNYLFTGQPDGAYHVRHLTPANFVNTSSPVRHVTLPTSGDAHFAAGDGSWAVISESYRVTADNHSPTTHLNNRSIHQTVVSGDFDLRVDATAISSGDVWNNVALIFDYQDPQNYYFFSSNQSNDAATNGIFRVVNGTSTELADIATTITPAITYELRVLRVGSSIYAYRDGLLLATASDATFTSGKIGLGTRQFQAQFDNLSATPLAALPGFSEDFSGRRAFAQDFGNFPLVFEGSGDSDEYDVKRTGLNSISIEETIAGSDPVLYEVKISSLAGRPVTINGDGGDDQIALHANVFFPNFAIDCGAGDDALVLSGSNFDVTASMFTDNSTSWSTYSGAENLLLSLNGGDLLEDLNGVNMQVHGPLAIRTPQHLKRLEFIWGDVTTAFGQIYCEEIIFTAGWLDMHNNDLIVDYTGPTPLGAWNGSQYTGLTGSVAYGGFWGPRIQTSLRSVGGTARTMGIGEASDVLFISGNETATWNGDTVDATTVIVKYTYKGDIDLNGEINGDDYFHIDSNVVNSGLVFGYHIGDINLDGFIDGDDYFWLDSQVLSQGPPL